MGRTQSTARGTDGAARHRSRRGSAGRVGARVLLAGAAALGGWTLVAPQSPAWNTTGDVLGFGQRDVRVFNNFTDPEANANQVVDPSFPGHVGAELAIWKGCIEWGSELHFEGAGDPLQPFDLGSGGSNFDLTWQGLAPDPGGTDDNVHSELAGNGVGVIAFLETPSSDGWRIRYYRNPWTFYDKPGNGPNGNTHMDLQGIACHEYGHALGLAHSNDPTATMFGSVLQNGTNWRSIEADDQAGIQSIYGVRSPSKPRITGYSHLGGGLTLLRGQNFDASANEVWFTRGAPGGDGTPVTVSGLASTNGGTELVVAVPPEAGPGDVLVKLPGTQFEALSSAFPFDPAANPCPQPVVYGNGKLTSFGTEAKIGFVGTPSTGLQNFKITLLGGPPGEAGLVFSGPTQKQVPFYGGWMLVGSPKLRHRRFTIDIFGFAQAKLNLDPAMVGVTRYYQVWFRDALDPLGAGTSNAVRVTHCD